MSSALYQTWSYLSHPFMLGHFFSVASLRRLRCRRLQCFAGYFALNVFLSAVIWSATWFGTLEIYSLLWASMWDLKCVYMTLCVCVCVWLKGRRKEEGGGIYSPIFLCMWWYESLSLSLGVRPWVCMGVRMCVCVWMNVDEKEKAALCIAVHHRQYPCFFSIHIHTPFSYPQQEQGGKCKCFWIYRNGRFRCKETSQRIWCGHARTDMRKPSFRGRTRRGKNRKKRSEMERKVFVGLFFFHPKSLWPLWNCCILDEEGNWKKKEKKRFVIRSVALICFPVSAGDLSWGFKRNLITVWDKMLPRWRLRTVLFRFVLVIWQEISIYYLWSYCSFSFHFVVLGHPRVAF